MEVGWIEGIEVGKNIFNTANEITFTTSIGLEFDYFFICDVIDNTIKR